MLWAFITAPTDKARHIAGHLRAADFYQPSHADLYRVAIAARRTSCGLPGPQHVMDAIATVMASDSGRHRQLVRDLLVAIVGLDVDPNRLVEYASTVLHLAMRRHAINHAQRVVQLTAHAQPDELHALIAEAGTALQDTGMQQRYRQLNGLPV
ncbi:replicative DNA helicase [Tsukamurella paurometabola]|uniref:replicative DNA helicase n=1 Tax=Tsukamurella paurometabola TaxID=2061 RepID=UPI0011C08169|nr:replicative DNA helicase [Tsukamurella paurometabola]